jgi:hypothetical protein
VKPNLRRFGYHETNTKVAFKVIFDKVLKSGFTGG